MKYTATAMMSLLLLGVCSAGRVLDMSQSHSQNEYKETTDDYRKTDEYMDRSQGDFYKSGQDNRRQDGQSLFKVMNQLKERVYQKLSSMYQQLTSNGNINSTDIYDLPAFADPLNIGVVVDKLALVTIDYPKVMFQGMGSAQRAVISVNKAAQEAKVKITFGDVRIYGQYKASDLIRKVSGDYQIKMTNAYYLGTYAYEVQQGGRVQMRESGGKLVYEGSDSHYENIGYFAQLFQGYLGRVLLRTVDEKVHDEVSAKLGARVRQCIADAAQGHEGGVEKMLQRGISGTFSGIQQMLSDSDSSSIELTNVDDKEMMYNNLRAKIASVRLNGLEKFYLAGNHVSYEKDKVRAQMQLAIRRPTATAIIRCHDALDDSAPFQKITVDFDIEQLLAELSLENVARTGDGQWAAAQSDASDSQSGLRVTGVQAYVSRIEPVSVDQKYEGDVAAFVKERLAQPVKRYIEEGLKKRMRAEMAAIFAQGAMLSTQQPKQFA